MVDSEGRVTFAGVPEGPYSLEVRSPDHDIVTATVQIAAGQLLELPPYFQSPFLGQLELLQPHQLFFRFPNPMHVPVQAGQHQTRVHVSGVLPEDLLK